MSMGSLVGALLGSWAVGWCIGAALTWWQKFIDAARG